MILKTVGRMHFDDNYAGNIPKAYFAFIIVVTTLCFLMDQTNAYLSPVSLKTKAVINESPEEVHSFLASPSNWPKFVASSCSVRSDDEQTDLSKPLKVGKTVDEVFGLPPLIPLSVQWICKDSTPPRKEIKGRFHKSSKSLQGRLDFFSPKGLDGVASNCRMIMDINPTNNNNAVINTCSTSTVIDLEVQYEPESILGVLARPILTIDNELALKVFLPFALEQKRTQTTNEESDLDKFRMLMGTLYGIAGVAHFLDCVVGSSELLSTAGAPAFEMLPLAGKAYALVWCAVGPFAFALSLLKGWAADFGLVLYGAVEVLGALLISLNYSGYSDAAGGMDALINAVLVQSIVYASWLFSRQKTTVN